MLINGDFERIFYLILPVILGSKRSLLCVLFFAIQLGMKKINSAKMNLLMLVCVVVGNMMGSGIFMLPANLAAIGSISIFGWFVTLIGILPLALIFAKLALVRTRSGGPCVYALDAFGSFIGFQSTYVYWIAAWVGNIGIAVAAIGYLSYFFPILAYPWFGCLAAIAVIWFFTLINLRGARTVGSVQIGTTICMLLPLVFIVLFGWFWFHPVYFVGAFNVSGKSDLHAISVASGLTMWSFIGLESALVSADSVENPKRNIPLATILGIAIAALIYIIASSVIIGVVPNSVLAHSNAPFSAAISQCLGKWAGWLTSICAMIACFGTLNGWTLVVTRLSKAAADNGLFPKLFGKTNKYNVPAQGLLIISALITVVLLFTVSSSINKQFQIIISTTTVLTLVSYLYAALASSFLLDKAGLKKSSRYGYNICVAIVSLYIIWTFLGVNLHVLIYGAIILLSSVFFYFKLKNK